MFWGRSPGEIRPLFALHRHSPDLPCAGQRDSKTKELGHCTVFGGIINQLGGDTTAWDRRRLGEPRPIISPMTSCRPAQVRCWMARRAGDLPACSRCPACSHPALTAEGVSELPHARGLGRLSPVRGWPFPWTSTPTSLSTRSETVDSGWRHVDRYAGSREPVRLPHGATWSLCGVWNMQC